MSDFQQTVLIYAGSSANSPVRDYIFYAGDSSDTARDYRVSYKLTISAIPGAISLDTWPADIVFLEVPLVGSIQAQPSLLELGGGTSTAWLTSTSSVALGGGPAWLYRLQTAGHEPASLIIGSGATDVLPFVFNYNFQLDTSVVSVDSSDLRVTPYAAIRVSSIPAGLTYQLRILKLESSSIVVGYSSLSTDSGVVTIGSANITLTRFEWYLNYGVEPTPSLVAVGSSELEQWRLRSSAISLSSSTTALYRIYSAQHWPSQVNVIAFPNEYFSILFRGVLYADSSQIDVVSTDLRRVPTSAIQVTSTDSGLVMRPRKWELATSGIVVGNLNLGYGDVSVTSSVTGFYKQAAATHSTSLISIQSFDIQLLNPWLVALPTSIAVPRSYARLRIIPVGYLPASRPTRRSFASPGLAVNKLRTMSGAKSRRLLCSKASKAVLLLEYENILDEDADLVLQAYVASLGSQYGFSLPPAALAGADSDLVQLFQPTATTHEWFFSDKPNLKSVSSGISSLSVSLQTRIKV